MDETTKTLIDYARDFWSDPPAEPSLDATLNHLIDSVGVAAIPPSAFYHDKLEGRDLVRFAFCKDEETLGAALVRLERLGT